MLTFTVSPDKTASGLNMSLMLKTTVIREKISIGTDFQGEPLPHHMASLRTVLLGWQHQVPTESTLDL